MAKQFKLNFYNIWKNNLFEFIGNNWLEIAKFHFHSEPIQNQFFSFLFSFNFSFFISLFFHILTSKQFAAGRWKIILLSPRRFQTRKRRKAWMDSFYLRSMTKKILFLNWNLGSSLIFTKALIDLAIHHLNVLVFFWFIFASLH